MYGKELGIFLLIALMGICYAVTAPLILVFTAVYFALAFVVYKHHLIYVYARAYESGGIFWPLLFSRVVLNVGFVLCKLGLASCCLATARSICRTRRLPPLQKARRRKLTWRRRVCAARV